MKFAWLLLTMLTTFRSTVSLTMRGIIQQSLVSRHERMPLRKGVPRVHYEYYSAGDEGNRSTDKALLVFVHGGAWKSGDSRSHYQMPFLAYLVRNGIDVISCNYRKTAWPDPLSDVVETFRQIERTYPGRRIIFCGASAGGHLATLAYYYNRFPARRRKQHRLLLFYPALDVYNDLQFHQPILLGRRSTLLSVFFDRLVVSRKKAPSDPQFPWVSPIQLLQEAPLSTWPDTMIAHGVYDPLTLYGASSFFVEELGKRSHFRRENDRILPVAGSHNFDNPDSPATAAVYEEMLQWIRKQ